VPAIDPAAFSEKKLQADFLKGDLVRHERFGIGRVEESSGVDCTAYFPRLEKRASKI
jgi:hypothetical protein